MKRLKELSIAKLEKMGKVVTLACVELTSVVVFGQTVYAGNGGMQDTVATLAPVWERLQRPASMAINGLSICIAIGCVVSMALDFIKSKQVNNPNEAQQHVQSAKNKAIAAAVAVALPILLNVLLPIFGIELFKVAI